MVQQLKIGEAAKLCGVTVRTLQYYDQKGLLPPSGLSDGGRRLYSESDIDRLRVILFFKDLGFSLKDIRALLNDDDPTKMLKLLIRNQERELRASVEESRRKLERLAELTSIVESLNDVTQDSIATIASLMGNRGKLFRMRALMVAVGLVMDAAWVAPLVIGIVLGIWWPLAIGIPVAVALGILVTRHYMTHTAYVCPEDETIFRPPFRQNFFARHTPSMRRLTCPVCGDRSYCLEVYVPDGKPLRENGYLIWR